MNHEFGFSNTKRKQILNSAKYCFSGNNSVNMNEVQCALCHNPANQRCTGCHITFYCGKEHQKLHWKKHKNNCCAFKVATSTNLGRHLIATRDLKPGELVLFESPLTIAPITSVDEPVCIVCYKGISGRFR